MLAFKVVKSIVYLWHFYRQKECCDTNIAKGNIKYTTALKNCKDTVRS